MENEPRSEPGGGLRSRLFAFCAGGAMAGLLTSPMHVLDQLVANGINSPMPAAEFAGLYSPLSPNLWAFIGERAEIFAAAPIVGAVFGALIAVFARGARTNRQALTLSLCLGSLFACAPLVASLLAQKPKLLFLTPVFFCHGALFGLATAVFAGVARGMLTRIRPASGETPQGARPRDAEQQP